MFVSRCAVYPLRMKRNTQDILMENLKAMRKSHNWTQMKLSEMSGVSDAMIGCIETGKKYPSLETLDKLAKAFSIPTYMLIYDSSIALDMPEADSVEAKKQLIVKLLDEISR